LNLTSPLGDLGKEDALGVSLLVLCVHLALPATLRRIGDLAGKVEEKAVFVVKFNLLFDIFLLIFLLKTREFIYTRVHIARTWRQQTFCTYYLTFHPHVITFLHK